MATDQHGIGRSAEAPQGDNKKKKKTIDKQCNEERGGTGDMQQLS